VVSIVYWAQVRSDEAERATIDDNTRWFDADALPGLAFDHNEIVAYALWRLRTKMEYARIAHSFLGDTFTLAELRQVYEAVLQKPMDPANFRRQVEASGSLVATDDLQTGGRHRPARLYRYNTDVVMADNGPLAHP
jgi:8-oxo-dGTP diphosphatase